MADLRGNRVLVTGAGRRLGAEIAVCLGGHGMKVAVHYQSSVAGAEETCRRIRAAGGEALPVRGDLRDPEQARGVVDTAIGGLQGLDLLVLSAASFERTPLATLEARSFGDAFALNTTAPLLMAQHAAGALARARGSIVLITCASRLAPYRNYLAYQVSKAALHQGMRLLALELAPEVRVNAVAPGSVLPPPGWSDAQNASLAEQVPLRRLGEASDVAEAVLHLARSEWLTGTELVVDGGRSAGDP